MMTGCRAKTISCFFLYLVLSQAPLTVEARRTLTKKGEYTKATARTGSGTLDQKLNGTAEWWGKKGTEDLDWKGCRAWTKSGCEDGDGCEYNYLWLDSPRQSCRYTDEYKLQEDQIATFFPVELARLEEKATKFAKKGCIYGGWFARCYRRMQQILRLFSYVNKAARAVKSAGDTHPAFQLVASSETKSRIAAVTKSMGVGFSKHSGSKKFCFEAAMEKLEKIPDQVLKHKQEAAEADEPLSEDELATFEASLQSAAMLSMMCTEVNEEQTKDLQAHIEASGALKEGDMDGDDVVDQAIKANADALGNLDSEGRDDLQTNDQEENDSELEEDDHEELVVPTDASGLIELQGNSTHDDAMWDDNGALLEDGRGMQPKKKKVGPLKWLLQTPFKALKWLFTHGLGWLLARTMWLILFMLGSVFSIVRAGVMFPLMFIFCFLFKGVGWLFGDFLYGFGWEGETYFLQTWKDPWKCAPWMWKQVGFETGSGSAEEIAKDTLGQIVVQPAMFASKSTGVWHPYKNVPAPDPCKDVTCGQFAYCSAGKCFCKPGHYQVPNTPDCGQMQTFHGCVCSTSYRAGIFNSQYYGCASDGTCKVDMHHPTYNQCKEKLKVKGFFYKMAKQAMNGTTVKSHDRCNFRPTPTQVPKVETEVEPAKAGGF